MRPRSAEAGFSLIETLVALVISTLVVMLLLDVTASGIQSNRRLEEQGIALADRLRAENRWRTLLAEGVPMRVSGGRLLAGEEELLRWERGEGSIERGADGLTRFRLVRDGRLLVVWIAA